MIAIDTNVLVYAIDDREPIKAAQASELINRLLSGDIPLVIPWQVAVEFMATLHRWEKAGRISRPATLAYLSRFVLSLPVKQPTVNTFSVALDLGLRHSLSYFDSLLLSACSELGVTTLYSEDMTSGSTYGTVTVINPF
jgi:predicted nucleic acid-binding protein